jgi:CheY-like chemotaxis protein
MTRVLIVGFLYVFDVLISAKMDTMNSNISDDRRVIIAFISAMMTAIQVQKVVEHLGYEITFIENAPLSSHFESSDLEPPAEPLFGRDASLVELITTQQPALLIFDLSNEGIPWQRWISTLKSSPATRRVPILCFSPHVDKQAIQAAINLNVDQVVARSRFMSQMPQLIVQAAGKDNSESIQESCGDLISKVALEGLEAFNAGNYFDAHEFLEEAWNEDTSEARDVYKAVLQIAVAYLQIERQNYRGAVKMFLRARQWLSPLPDVCRGINIDRLKDDANHVHQILVEMGPDQISDFDRSFLQPVDYKQPG